MTEPAGNGSRRRLVAIGGAIAVLVAVVVVVVATRSDDAPAGGGGGPTEIQGAATVTGITAVGAVMDTHTTGNSAEAGTPPAISTATTNTAIPALQRALLEPGGYDCTDTGVWQPFTELELTLLVGEPAGGSSCTSDVLDMPLGSCSASPCGEVPADWRFDTLAGTPPEALMMIVAPVSSSTAEFVCVVDLVPQPKQILLVTTTIEQACPTGVSSDSIDIPDVPPDTSDIPYVPPPASVDLPAG